MPTFQTVYKSPYYFGEISLEEAKNILKQNPPNSYLFRREENGTVTLATLYQGRELLELEIMNCDCGVCPKETYQRDNESLAHFVKSFDQAELTIESLKQASASNSYPLLQLKQPISRKNTLPLEEMAKYSIQSNYPNSIHQLKLPKIIKDNLIHHPNHRNAI